MSEKKEGLAALVPHMADTKVPPAVGIGAIALEMAMKYCAINTVQDGALYQQYKLEGRNIVPLHLEMVFETAIQIEKHLLATSDRIAEILIDAIAEPIEGEQPPQQSTE